MANTAPPRALEVHAAFRQYCGPRYEAADLRIQFPLNQSPGVHFKTDVSSEYRGAILKGLTDGMSLRFPNFLDTGSVWVTEVTVHPVDSSAWAFYRVARCAIEQAYTLSQLKDTHVLKSSD
jgi:hypothetical protein